MKSAIQQISSNPPAGSVQSPRRLWIDYARGIAIILVVFGHVSKGFENTFYQGKPLVIDNTVYSILQVIYFARMPLFFVISGLYIRNSYLKRGFTGFVNYKFSTILYPYLIWATIQVLFQYIGYRYGFSNTPRTEQDFGYLLYRPDKIDQFWFLYTLFEVALLFAVLYASLRLNKIPFFVVGLLAYILYYYLPDTTFVFGLKYTCKFLFYIALGDIIAKTILSSKNFNKFSSLFLTVILVSAFFLIKYAMFIFNVPEEENRFFTWQNALLIIFILSGIALILNISFVLERYNILVWLRIVGKHSLYIYVMHIIINGIVRYLVLKITDYKFPDLSVYIVVFMSILIPIYIYKILNRLGIWFLFSLEREKSINL